MSHISLHKFDNALKHNSLDVVIVHEEDQHRYAKDACCNDGEVHGPF